MGRLSLRSVQPGLQLAGMLVSSQARQLAKQAENSPKRLPGFMSWSGLGQQPCLSHSRAPHRSHSPGQPWDALTAATASSSAELPVHHRPGKLPTSPTQIEVSVSDLASSAAELRIQASL